jgi:hypothetical protein
MKALALLFAALLIVGCGSQPAPAPKAERAPDTTKPIPAEVSFAKDIQSILTQNCMPCHAGGQDAKGRYDLTCYANTMGPGKDSVANVLPGNADSSTLYCRVAGTVPPQMPKDRPPLNAAQLSTIKNWINQGAKNN